MNSTDTTKTKIAVHNSSEYQAVHYDHRTNMQSVLGKVIGPKEVHPENLDGRVAVVTGGALGIGYVFHMEESVLD